ncbi:MAG: uracil-DNA glycosylase [Alphaproteobacteria bacterium]|nr:uracil-DNA glycosylase [Alphaproteobacteria bacterium]
MSGLDNIASLDELRQVIENFDDCPLKALARKTVFSDGNPKSPVMFIGEAPGAEEDAQGLPFVGLSGQLLDRMMNAIGLDRTKAYISNIVPWRPPGNRTPSPIEIAQCLPFIQRHIEIVKPRIIVLVGATAVKALLQRQDGIMKLRGQWFSYATPKLESPIAALATFHPAYLLRSPGQKREAWKDMLMIQKKLNSFEEETSSHA